MACKKCFRGYDHHPQASPVAWIYRAATLRRFLKKTRAQHGKAQRIWAMDGGIPMARCQDLFGTKFERRCSIICDGVARWIGLETGLVRSSSRISLRRWACATIITVAVATIAGVVVAASGCGSVFWSCWLSQPP